MECKIILDLVLFANNLNDLTLLCFKYSKENNIVIVNFLTNDSQHNVVFNLLELYPECRVIKLNIYNWWKTSWNCLLENRILSYTLNYDAKNRISTYTADAEDDPNEEICITLFKIRCIRDLWD